MSKSIFNAIFCGALFVTGLPTSWAQNSSLPLCAPSARTLDWHMCRNKEDLGGGLVIDHEYRNGVPFFASGRQYPEGTFSLVEKFSLSKELQVGLLDMSGGRVYIDLAGLNVNGTKRIFGVLFDFPYGYAMSRITSMKSFLGKMTVDCSAQKMLLGEVSGFYGVMGEGDLTPMELGVFEGKSIAMTDLEDADAGVFKSDVVRVFKSVMGSVCAPDIITQVNSARNGRQRIEKQSNFPACPASGYFHNCFGTRKWGPNGTYVGDFKDDKSHGQGTLTLPDGSKYVGEFKDGRGNGQGTETYADGNQYVGEFKDGKRNGQFTATFPNGDKYVGEFKDGKYNGQGTYTFADGNKYVGEFKNGDLNGQGIYTFANGNKYVGEFKDGKRNGQFTATFPNGDKYVGEFKDGKYNGQGTYTYAGGNNYVGEFKDDKRNGPGIFYLANGGISDSGIWIDNSLVTSQYVDPNSFTRIAKGNSTPSATEAQRQENERKAAQLEEVRKRLEEDKRQIALERQRIESQKVQPQIAPDNRRRLALVIGNDNYSSMPRLSNAVNDSNSMNDALKQANFEVMHYKNLNKRSMEEALQNFTQKLGKDDVGLFYFAGHGVQANSKNFLIPVGENVKLSADVQFEGMDVNRVMASLQGSKNSLNIVVLDACRSSLPERGGMSRGLTVTEAPQGSIVAYATAPGKAASDGDVGNSPFTKNLVRVMQKKGLKIEDVFKEVRVAVSRETNGEQVPQEVSQLVDDFYFRP